MVRHDAAPRYYTFAPSVILRSSKNAGADFNKLGSLGGSGLISAIIFVIVFLLGHVLNFALCALGSYVHASRLQFIEFFGKFYEAGGKKFNALGVEGKYTEIL